MTERLEQRPRVEDLFDAVRGIDAPPGAANRVFREVEEKRLGSPWASWFRGWYALPVAMAGVAIALLWSPVDDGGGVAVMSSQDVTLSDGAAIARMLPSGSEVAVGEAGHLRLKAETAEVTLESGSRGMVNPESMRLDEGRSRISGAMHVSGNGCEADVKGESQVEVIERSLVFTVFAGSVQVSPPQTACRIIELEKTDGAKPRASARGNTGEATAKTEEPLGEGESGEDGTGVDAEEATNTGVEVTRRRKSRDANRPSVLAAQVKAYEEAKALGGSNDAEALKKWMEHRRRFRSSPMRHEVDVNIVETLIRLGRVNEAKREARRFVRRHPKSPRRAEMQRVVSGGDR